MPLSKTGPPREGFEYQDLHGALAVLDWLAHPANYAWIKFEAAEYGSLDDFVICDSNRNLQLNQVKHTGEGPDRLEFTFDDLTESPSARRRSLFEKWYKSWMVAKRRVVFTSITPILKTNKPACSDMLALTKSAKNGRIFDVTLLKSHYAVLYSKLHALASKSTDSELDEFLHVLQFEFEQPDIPALRDIAQEKCRALSLGPDVYKDLEDEVWNWAKRGSELSLQDVKRACGWFEPRGLDQRFPIPSDYVRLGDDWIDEFSKVLTGSRLRDGGIRLIVGTPGSGKSTFLEDLYKSLVEQDVPCIRHHYYIPGMERYDRLQFEDAASALIHDLVQLGPNVAPGVNPRPQELGAIITAAAASLQQNNEPLLVILDGLDHVIREEDEGELIELLRKILPRRPGLWLVLGTRDFPRDSRVSGVLEEYLARDRWSPMPRFSYDECTTLLSFHRAELHLVHDNHFDEIASAFFNVTDGYPLHCRYVIGRLIELAASQVPLASDFEHIEPFGGDVPALYGQIWKSLSSAAWTIAVLLAVAQFEISENEISSALPSVNTVDVLAGFKLLKPLLAPGLDGWRFFHPSFAEYVRTTDEFSSVAPRLRRDLIGWLENGAPEEKRWTWLLRKKAEYGDAQPLISQTTRTWIIESLHEGREFEEVVHTLELASTAAMNRNDYASAFARGQHSIYMQNSLQFSEQEWNRLEVLNRRRIAGSVLRKGTRSDITYRDPAFLLEIARDADFVGERDIIQDVVDELNSRLVSPRKPSFSYPESAKNLIECLLRVAALLRGRVARAATFIDREVNPDHQGGAAAAFADELVRSEQQIAFLEFVNSSRLPSTVSTEARDAGALAAFYSNNRIKGEIAQDGLWWRIYQAVTMGGIPSGQELPNPSDIPKTLPDYDSTAQSHVINLYKQVFAGALLCDLAGKRSEVETWITGLPDGWGEKAAGLIAKLALRCGTALCGKQDLEHGSISDLNSLDRLEFGKDREVWGFRISVRKALIEVLPTVFVVLQNVTGMTLDAQWASELSDCQFLEDQAVTELMNNLPARVLRREEIRVWVSKQEQRWDSRVDEFPTRAEAYSSLAALSFRIDDLSTCSVLTRKTIENLLGYGNHKDLFLYEGIESVGACTNFPPARDWFTRLAPISNSVADFTDRDETSRLAVDFGAALTKYDRFAAFRQYVDLVNEERLYLAEDLFAKLIPHLDLSQDLEHAIARTCTDYDSRKALRDRLDPPSIAIADELQSLYGQESPPEQRDSGLPGETTTEPQISDVTPDNLRNAVSVVRYSRNQAAFIGKWLEFWIPKSPQEAYSALKPWLDPERRASFEGGIALQAYPYVRGFEGPDVGFALLCSAHRSSYGWSRFFADSGAAKDVFDILQRDYPHRWREFIHETLKHRRPESYGILPVPVGVHFLIRFGANDEAARLCEAAVKTLEELMDGLPLPHVHWLEKPATALEVLFARLFWISPVVRERTALVLSELLLAPACSKDVFEYFVWRLANEHLDSRVVILLMPIVRAAKHGFRPDIHKLTRSLQVSSTTVKTLVQMIEAAA